MPLFPGCLSFAPVDFGPIYIKIGLNLDMILFALGKRQKEDAKTLEFPFLVSGLARLTIVLKQKAVPKTN